MQLTDDLRAEYQHLWDTAQIRNERRALTEIAANSVLANRDRYEAVGEPLGIPWYFIGAVHNMESSQNFARHLHNGDLLTARTVHVPAGRPVDGEPPFTWEESADDALRLMKLDQVVDWSLPGTLYQLERYNGWGYRRHHPETLSPYLWAATNHYTSGKYVADGKWDSAAVSTQIGAAALLLQISPGGVTVQSASAR